MKKKELIDEAPEVTTNIALLDASFGQEDLNKTVAKINEIIEYINEHQ